MNIITQFVSATALLVSVLHATYTLASTNRFGAATSISTQSGATSTLPGYLNVTGTVSTSTFSGALVVSKTASTTNLIVSGTCTGCGGVTYTASSTAFSTNTTQTFTGSIPTNATFAVVNAIDITETGGPSDNIKQILLFKQGATQVSVTNAEDNGAEANSCTYRFDWTGSNFVVNETDDVDGDCSITGTTYWY